MIFTRYTSASAFAGDVTELLKRHEIQNNLFFLNLQVAAARTDVSDILMATVKDDGGAVLLTAVRTPPYTALLFETDNIPNDAALAFFAESLIQNKIDIGTVQAGQELAKRFCDVYTKLAQKSVVKKESLVLYVLERVSALSLPAGSFRKAAEADMFYLPYWLSDFVPACHLGDYDLNVGAANAKRLIGEENAYIWEDGIPVTTASCVRRTSDCGFIGQVYTPPQYRGKGYATACVSHLTQRILASGMTYCGLYADCANPYSNKVYRKIGYQAVSLSDQYELAPL